MSGLAGRRALVTGGGRGIGAAIARSLAAAGCRVLVAARTAEEVEGVAGELREAGYTAAHATCDVTSEGDVTRLLSTATRQLGGVDILVNNAGVSMSAPLGKTSLDEWNRMLAVNATGSFLCLRAFLPGMTERGWGRVVNIASVAGLSGSRYIGAYAASKHAVMGLTRSVAAEVATKGVTINAVCPDFVDTPMTEASIANLVDKTGRSEVEARQAILDTLPQGRLITPEEVAHAVLMLCSDDARGINGQAVVIDGGSLLA